MANSRFYSSTAAVTNLQVTANSGDASIQVASSTGFPNSFPFTLSLDYGSANEELVDVTGGGPSVFNVTRAVDGTSATTHNAGAVVRHVSSARDFTDSRTHEASTTSVHGITGAFVDTLSVQTLQNKTLSSPVINNGTVAGSITATGATVTNGTLSGSTLSAGTITGATTMASTPALSGAWTNSGNITNTGQLLQQNLVRGSRANTSDSMYESRITGDANARWFETADGTQAWGPGSTSADVSLGRSGAGVLHVTGSLDASVNLTAAAMSATGTLTGANLALTGQTFTSFTPVWHGTDASFNTNTGWYTKFGKMVFYEIYAVWSTSSSLTGSVSVDLPTTPFRTGGLRQQLGTVWFTDVAAGGSFPDTNCMGHHCTFAGDTGVTTQPLKNYRDNTFTGGLIVGPSPATIVTINGCYREA